MSALYSTVNASLDSPAPAIDADTRQRMNQLYHAAVRFRRAQLDFCDRVNILTLRKLLDEGENLGQLLTHLNGGRDPVSFVSRTGALLETAAELAKEPAP